MDPVTASIVLSLTNLKSNRLTAEELRDLFTGRSIRLAASEIPLPKGIEIGAFGGEHFLLHGRHRVFLIVTDCMMQSEEVEGA